MSLPLHHTHGPRALPEQPLPGGLSPGLLRGRVHELCGPSRVSLALMLLHLCDGPVIWVAPSWVPERPYPCGMVDFVHPGRIVFAQARRHEDINWCAEEALRSGAAPVVLVEMPVLPGLTPVRRMHLAAEAGAEAARHAGRPAPLGLLLTAGDGGAQGVESRWHMAPRPAPSGLVDEGGSVWALERRRARGLPPAGWLLTRATPAGDGPYPGADTSPDVSPAATTITACPLPPA